MACRTSFSFFAPTTRPSSKPTSRALLGSSLMRNTSHFCRNPSMSGRQTKSSPQLSPRATAPAGGRGYHAAPTLRPCGSGHRKDACAIHGVVCKSFDSPCSAPHARRPANAGPTHTVARWRADPDGEVFRVAVGGPPPIPRATLARDADAAARSLRRLDL